MEPGFRRCWRQKKYKLGSRLCNYNIYIYIHTRDKVWILVGLEMKKYKHCFRHRLANKHSHFQICNVFPGLFLSSFSSRALK